MIAEPIKTLLGAELTGQVEAALKGKGKNGADFDLITETGKNTVPLETHQQLQAQLTRLQKTTALKLGLGAGVHDPEDIISRLDLDKLELDEQGNLMTKLEDLIAPIRESKPYLFKEPPKQELNLQGAVPGQVSAQNTADASEQQLNDAFGLKGE